MKTGKTDMRTFAQELQRQNDAKRDFVVDTRSAGFYGFNDGKMWLELTPPDDDTQALHFGMTDLFHRQMGAALGIPAKYYDKMRVDYPELLAKNINGWFGKEPSKHTIRTMDNMARAFLSDRYRRIDNFEVASATLTVIGEMPDAPFSTAL